ncbi:hypothetical protein INT47_003028 [Mucor saturninus]|uniref:SCP domain-containing protein n=1 Tax=Mucor saturninus TaxID=64648 RepID=A0A8H7QV23_9FUNG|nr:hypothetical protein INT47_003028 [Mucor saturninus]
MLKLLIAALLATSVSCLVKREMASEEDIKTILDAHNELRKSHGAEPVVWDEEIAAYAYDWSTNCEINHSTSPHGENIAGRTNDWKHTVEAWYSEIKDYDFSKPGFDPYTGHFTQVVWHNTKKIGCGVTQCDNIQGGLYVCEYEPRGNIILGGADPNVFFRTNVTEKIQ